MSFTLIMAVTAAVAATMGYMAARRRGEDGDDDEEELNEAPPKDSPKLGAKKAEPKLGAKKAEPKPGAKKAEPKPRKAADPKSAFEGMPLMLGDVVSAEHEERWLAGALVAREEERVVAALFLAPEGNKHVAVAAFVPPRREIFWMDPAELTSPEEPPATIELGGVTMRRKGRLPVSIERLGQGAPQVSEEAIWAAYEGGGRDVAVVIVSEGRAYAWMGRRLDEEEYDRLGEG
jgi:hypothetical protein